jgi:hypothetical protein
MDDERERVERLIESLVRAARIPRRRDREELRRELWTHFEESGLSPEELGPALARFGDGEQLAAGFRHVYRRAFLLVYVLKLGASALGSAVVALLIQVAANLRFGGMRLGGGAVLWRLAPDFSRTALVSVAVALGAVAAWESLRRPFELTRGLLSLALYGLASLAVQELFGRGAEAFLPALVIVALGYATSRLEIRPSGLLLAYVAFSIVIYGAHQAAQVSSLGIARSLSISAALLAVWAASLAILARVDRAFRGLLQLT